MSEDTVYVLSQGLLKKPSMCSPQHGRLYKTVKLHQLIFNFIKLIIKHRLVLTCHAVVHTSLWEIRSCLHVLLMTRMKRDQGLWSASPTSLRASLCCSVPGRYPTIMIVELWLSVPKTIEIG
jgi:hypothetical protein